MNLSACQVEATFAVASETRDMTLEIRTMVAALDKSMAYKVTTCSWS